MAEIYTLDENAHAYINDIEHNTWANYAFLRPR
jgi:hypothetical protein